MALLAGNGIELSHQHIVIAAWFGLLLVPPVLAVVAVFALPWVGVDLNVNKPGRQIAQFFAESFQRRTGTPLQAVAGDPRTAALISLGAPSRPSLFLDATPERTPWVTFDDVRRKGAIIVWPTNDAVGTPPPEIKERFPDLKLDTPRLSERPAGGTAAGAALWLGGDPSAVGATSGASQGTGASQGRRENNARRSDPACRAEASASSFRPDGHGVRAAVGGGGI